MYIYIYIYIYIYVCIYIYIYIRALYQNEETAPIVGSYVIESRGFPQRKKNRKKERKR